MNPLHLIGADNIPDTMQGPVPDLALVVGMLGWLRHKNCHTAHCWRIGHPDQNGTVKCRRHR